MPIPTTVPVDGPDEATGAEASWPETTGGWVGGTVGDGVAPGAVVVARAAPLVGGPPGADVVAVGAEPGGAEPVLPGRAVSPVVADGLAPAGPEPPATELDPAPEPVPGLVAGDGLTGASGRAGVSRGTGLPDPLALSENDQPSKPPGRAWWLLTPCWLYCHDPPFEACQ